VRCHEKRKSFSLVGKGDFCRYEEDSVATSLVFFEGGGKENWKKGMLCLQLLKEKGIGGRRTFWGGGDV